MDVMSLIEKAWDKGAWCIVAVALVMGVVRVLRWLKPWLEKFFDSQIKLVTSLESTTKDQATANQAHAEANQQTANTVSDLRPMLEDLHRTVCKKATA